MKNALSDFFAVVTFPYPSWSDKQLATDSKQIQLACTLNPYFPSPVPNMVTFGAGVDAFIEQVGKAGSRDVNAVAAKNARRLELVQLLTALTINIAGTAAGNREQLAGTLIPLRKLPQPVIVNNPENFRITLGKNPGALNLKINGSKAKATIFEYTENPPTDDSIWTRITCSKSSFTVSGLQAGKRYWFRVTSVGGRNQLAWGETILSPYVQ